MSDYLVQEIRRLRDVDLRLHSEITGGDGDGVLERVMIRDIHSGAVETVAARSVFVLIGALPHTEWLSGAVQRNPEGYIMTGSDVDTREAGWPKDARPERFETSMPGVFAAGDVRLGSVKRVASAAGEGSVAVQFIHEYLKAPVALEEAVPDPLVSR
jgi:thioredoxin reductase (NADPH)